MEMDDTQRPAGPNRRPLLQISKRITQAASAVGKVAGSVGEAISRTAASAGELLGDPSLRRKGATIILSEASKGFQEVQKGLQDGAGALGRGLQAGAATLQRNIKQAGKSQMQVFMTQLETRIQHYRLREQLREQRQQGVDIQLGPHVYEDAPQELRSRLWFVILTDAGLIQPLLPIQKPAGYTSPEPHPNDAPLAASELLPPLRSASPRTSANFKENLRHISDNISAKLHRTSSSSSPTRGPSPAPSTPSTPAAAASLPPRNKTASSRSVTSAASHDDDEGCIELHSLTPPSTTTPSPRAQPGSPVTGAAGRPPRTPDAILEASTLGDGGGEHELPPSPATQQQQRRQQEWRQQQRQNQQPEEVEEGTVWPSAAPPPKVQAWGSGAEEAWEVVSEAEGLHSGNVEAPQQDVVATLKETLSLSSDVSVEGPEGASARQEARRALMRAMIEVPWPIPADYPEDCSFAVFNNITAGQEEVDEVIARDISRTFPEHPLFGFQAGQQALFRILKAYSVFDLEVGYCQGMAFAAGIFLMYLPEELAFRLFCNLMDPTGPNLRRLYLPGLEDLKRALTAFDHLLLTTRPVLAAHLQAHAVPSVLFASQWLLTVYACPFPATLSARVIDVLLQDNNDRIMLRLAVAIMAELEPELLALDDFEAVITHIKVSPLQWSKERIRHVFKAALHSPISDEALAASERFAAEEHQRLRHTSSRGRGMATPDGTPTAAATEQHASAASHGLSLATSPSPSVDPLPSASSGTTTAPGHTPTPSTTLGDPSATAAGLNAAAGVEAGAGGEAEQGLGLVEAREQEEEEVEEDESEEEDALLSMALLGLQGSLATGEGRLGRREGA